MNGTTDLILDEATDLDDVEEAMTEDEILIAMGLSGEDAFLAWMAAGE